MQSFPEPNELLFILAAEGRVLVRRNDGRTAAGAIVKTAIGWIAQVDYPPTAEIYPTLNEAKAYAHGYATAKGWL